MGVWIWNQVKVTPRSIFLPNCSTSPSLKYTSASSEITVLAKCFWSQHWDKKPLKAMGVRKGSWWEVVFVFKYHEVGRCWVCVDLTWKKLASEPLGIFETSFIHFGKLSWNIWEFCFFVVVVWKEDIFNNKGA